MDIEELIAVGIERLEQDRKARQAKREAAERAEEEERRQKIEVLKEKLRPGIPETLLPYVNFAPLAKSSRNRSFATVGFDVPGCTDISLSFDLGVEYTPDNWYVKYPEDWRLLEDEEDLRRLRVVIRYEVERFLSSELEQALGFAALMFQKEERFKAEGEAESARRAAEHARWEEGRAERQAQQQADRAAEAEELARTLDIVRRDPVALALVRLFVAVHAGRERCREGVERAQEMLDGVERRYQERLEQAQRAEVDVQRQADDYRRQMYEAEEKAERLAKRGR